MNAEQAIGGQLHDYGEIVRPIKEAIAADTELADMVLSDAAGMLFHHTATGVIMGDR